MTKRVAITAAVKEAVLKEFDHLCAVCGSTGPQIHHIDEDNTNSDPNNLLPLCPNCHLRDQHNPTSHIDVDILHLFRKHRDPTILLPQFVPLWRRVTFLLNLQFAELRTIESSRSELVRFVQALQMGSFYGSEVERLLPLAERWLPAAGAAIPKDRLDDAEQKSFNAMVSNVDKVLDLVIELLRYQPWTHPSSSKRVMRDRM